MRFNSKTVHLQFLKDHIFKINCFVLEIRLFSNFEIFRPNFMVKNPVPQLFLRNGVFKDVIIVI